MNRNSPLILHEDVKLILKDNIVKDFVGSGTYGVVYKIMDSKSRICKIMKIIMLPKYEDDSIHFRNIKSAFHKTLTSLISPKNKYILPIEQFEITSRHISIKMSDLTTCSLGYKLYVRPSEGYDEKDIQRYMRNILIACQSLHSNDIIHGNLKPGNIFLLCQEPYVYLSDLLIYISANTPLQLSNIKYSSHIRYQPPEVIFLNNPRNSKTDVWSIGIILLELCFGYYRFGTYQYKQLQHDDLKKIFEISNIKYSSDLYQFLLECLEPYFAKRKTIQQLLENKFISKSFDKKNPFPCCFARPKPSIDTRCSTRNENAHLEASRKSSIQGDEIDLIASRQSNTPKSAQTEGEIKQRISKASGLSEEQFNKLSSIFEDSDTDELKKVIFMCPNEGSFVLNLANINLQSKQYFQKVAQSLEILNQISEINLSGCHIDNSILKYLVPKLNLLKSLSKIILSNNLLTDDFIGVLQLLTIKQIVTIDISENPHISHSKSSIQDRLKQFKIILKESKYKMSKSEVW